MSLPLRTFPEASFLASTDLPRRQGRAVNLHAGDSPAEVAPVADPGAHPCRGAGRQPDPADLPGHHEVAVHEQAGGSRAPVVRGSHELPAPRPHFPADQSRREAAAPTGEAREQGGGADHPEMHAPAIGLVVEDRTSFAFVIDPGQQGDGASRVDSSIVGELHVAVRAAEELRGAIASSIRATREPHVARDVSGGIRAKTYIPTPGTSG